jgi:hypothetical protein
MSTTPQPEAVQAETAAQVAMNQNENSDLPHLDALPPLLPQTTCSCSKTRCLKLYCDCFSSGSLCQPSCECIQCSNFSGSNERIEAIRNVLDRKPEAFGEEIAREVGWVAVPVVPKKRGRPKGSLNKNRSEDKKPRGRPSKESSGQIEDHSFLEAIPFDLEQHPQLALDTRDHSSLANSFARPLFSPTDHNTSEPLRIAYSHRHFHATKRKIAASKRNQIQDEFDKLRDKYLQKKLELSLANEEVARLTKETGGWTKKVFDLELVEPCQWNDNLERLRRFKEERGCLPNRSRCESGEERELSDWLEGIRGNKVCSCEVFD